MVHAAIRAVKGTLLFHDWAEARVLWDQLTQRVRLHALVLIPDHVHAQLLESALRDLATAPRAYALLRNHARGERGPVWEHGAHPTPIRGDRHVERTRRYIHLNPCRRELVLDPLAWPFSTHRDVVGLAIPAACRAVPNPERWHAYVSSDPSVRVAGTSLPARRAERPATLLEVHAAVSSLTRTPASEVTRRPAARDLLIRAARALTTASSVEIAALAGVHPTTVTRHASCNDGLVELVERVLGDTRFASLGDGDLRARWSRCRPGQHGSRVV